MKIINHFLFFLIFVIYLIYIILHHLLPLPYYFIYNTDLYILLSLKDPSNLRNDTERRRKMDIDDQEKIEKTKILGFLPPILESHALCL